MFPLKILLIRPHWNDNQHKTQKKEEIQFLFYLFMIIITYTLRVFHISGSRWFFTRVWETASLLKSPGLYSVIWLLKKAVACLVSTRPLTSKSPSRFNNPLVTVLNAQITTGIIVTSMFHRFSILQQGPGTYHSFPLLSVLFCGQPVQQSPEFCKFSFFVDYCFVYSSARD